MTVTTFSELELDESLLEALQDKGFTRPTAIQAAAIPPALDGRDVLGSAPTGTGKTAAYLLPALQHLLDFPRKKSGPPRILILTPTRELAMQVADHARELAKHTHLDIATITGGVAYMNHAEVFSENQDIVVATTGRLLQYIKEENFDCRAVETLILDEADRMLDMGFAQDIEHIAGETRWRKQTLLFSATLEGDAIQDFAERLLEDPVEVSANPSTRERKKIHQWYYRADDLEHKTALLVHLLKQPEATRSIVFVRKRERVHSLTSLLSVSISSSFCSDCGLEFILRHVLIDLRSMNRCCREFWIHVGIVVHHHLRRIIRIRICKSDLLITLLEGKGSCHFIDYKCHNMFV